MGKTCINCNETKSLDEFHNWKFSKDGKTYICKVCAVDKANQWSKDNIESVVKNKRERRRNNPEAALLESAQNRARKLNLPLNITKDDIHIPVQCPILKIDLKRNIGRAGDDSPSLDRIIPELGYVKGNIQVISNKANKMKSNASVNDLLSFAFWINQTFKE